MKQNLQTTKEMFRSLVKLILNLVFLLFIQETFCQNVIKPKELYKPTQEEVTDGEYGIIIYNKLVPCIGGDSIRYNKAGYNAQSWQEDFYVSGKLLHRGFYIDGQIKVFKNYWENGNLEREFILIDNLRCKMNTYYPNAQPRSEATFYEGTAIKEKDFFENGVVELEEEIDKRNGFLIMRHINYSSAKPKVAMDMTDKKTRTYTYKEYYENGNLKEEGGLTYRKDYNDYVKNGIWKFYSETGTVTKSANFINNEEQK